MIKNQHSNLIFILYLIMKPIYILYNIHLKLIFLSLFVMNLNNLYFI